MSQTASWLVLIVAGVREACWAIGPKYSEAASAARLASIGSIVAGKVGLKLATPS